jgi:hypothetical protein
MLPITHISVPIADLSITQDGKQFFVSSSSLPKTTTTARFWKGMKAFNLTEGAFNLFDSETIMAKLQGRYPDTVLTLTIETTSTEGSRALGVTTGNLVDINRATETLQERKAWNINYVDGVISGSFHEAWQTVFDFVEIQGQKFYPVNSLFIPIDGLGKEQVLAGFMNATSGSIVTPEHSFLQKADKETALALITKRLNSAAISWASVADLLKSEAMINDGYITEKLNAFAHNPRQAYGITNFNQLPQEKLQSMPVGCTLFDLIQFIASYTAPENKQKVCKLIGQIIFSEYSLMGSAKNKTLPSIFVGGV